MASGGSALADFTGFAVEMKTDCPHVQACGTCGNVGENWLCLVCSCVFCSRYVNCHMVEHNSETGHMVVLSFSDVSIWCYECDSYITSPLLQSITQAAELAKQ